MSSAREHVLQLTLLPGTRLPLPMCGHLAETKHHCIPLMSLECVKSRFTQKLLSILSKNLPQNSSPSVLAALSPFTPLLVAT
eukprot:CAMPEP_0171244624 /NCGR_PEP_ID=MMETSP0790-20130122/46959_1 /TAXON_ID=2925 /ORGANISM="Alexandrium catenella, Strain OF101" /LENGTH=81 /DNA_ID=CAMNT_0011711775 /DNA_START=341 /DNA_END=586 /DNA_ORIENTATION=+